MSSMTQEHLAEFVRLFPEGQLTTDPAICEKYGRDYYWFSPVLRESLRDSLPEAVVHARSLADVERVVGFCSERDIPLTPRGAGTGNYGQAMPTAGGVLLDFQTLVNEPVIDAAQGTVRCLAGTRCQTIEEAARQHGWELQMYPSTWVKSTIGGFLAGGSGGIGSIRHGLIGDGRFVRGLTILSSGTQPRLFRVTGEDCLSYLHAYGTTGLILEVELNLAPKLPWDQVLFSGKDFAQVYGFAVQLGIERRFDLRLLNFQEWPIPSFFIPIRKYLAEGEHILQIEVVSSQLPALRAAATAAGLTERFWKEHHEPRRAPMLSDFVQNHSTLWAKKADSAYTYSSIQLDLAQWREHIALLKEAPGSAMHLRCDFNRRMGKLTAAAGPIYRAETAEEVRVKQDYLKSVGLFFYDVHQHYLDRDGMQERNATKIALSCEIDPLGILNRGRIRSLSAKPGH